MKKRKFGLALSMVLAAGTILGACGSDDNESSDGSSGGGDDAASNDFTVSMVTDTGGVDDKSFNQSAWEGLQAFGEEYDLEEGTNGYNYFQSNNDADYVTNFNTAARSEFDLVFGIGFLLTEAIGQVAAQQTDTNFAIVDDVAEGDNVASITFKEHEGSFLVGVVAGLTTESNKIGFIGGVESDLINKFAAGFQAGVEAVNPDAQIDIQFSGDFNNASRGQQMAAAMYGSGTDVIYHAAGGTGNGVFTEAKNLKQQDPDRQVWVIGVDRDQAEEGALTANGEEYNVTLTSMVKRVDIAVQDISKRAMDGDFPGGEVIEYGIEEGGISIAETQDNLTQEILDEVENYKQQILDGEIEVPSTR
ncbi:BMP family lipoprotein [Jeotgalibacillus proteolyticus]|uniref:BMP family ABC transporter substrate-binding protein n=1 Tax=Jeotgalibacillus proteolyticus TaxID=2082395 RepID=A0A2S5GG59_9BACL|nr:BMP family protein [Jeotgalibacillus proteolyticus]PPA72007.1 BMP family ABC transporter substrate-binding protein [Jeotgalibacillus proteolyticus]